MKKQHKHKDLIIAWANGAEIECLNDRGIWVEIVYPNWFDDKEYRIKPEKKEPKLIPFDTEKEIENLIGRAVVSKVSGSTFIITGVSRVDEDVCIGGSWCRLYILLEYYTFLDGSPCGKYVED